MQHDACRTPLEEIATAVHTRGVAPVARDLDVARSTLSAVLVGNCREASRELVFARWRERMQSKETDQ